MKTRHLIALLVLVLGLGIGVGIFLRPAAPTVTMSDAAPAVVATEAPASATPSATPATARPRGIARRTPAELAKLQHAIPLMSGLDPAGALADARGFAPLDDAQKMQFAEELAAFRATTDLEQRVEILDRIESLCYGEAIVPLLVELVSPAQPPDLRSKAIDLVAGNTSAAILPVLDAALHDPDPLFQARAVLAANHVPGPALVDFLGRVFAHPDANTRLAGLECFDEQPVETRIAALQLALRSAQQDLQLGAVEKLTGLSSHQSVEALIPLLAVLDERVRGQAGAALHFLVGEEFTGVAEALAWWKKNRARFDKELNEK